MFRAEQYLIKLYSRMRCGSLAIRLLKLSHSGESGTARRGSRCSWANQLIAARTFAL
jgi:hypothetical protein